MSAEHLKRFAVLEELSDEERELLDESLATYDLHEGRVLFEEGVEAEGLFLLLKGEVTLESKELGRESLQPLIELDRPAPLSVHDVGGRIGDELGIRELFFYFLQVGPRLILLLGEPLPLRS